MTFASFAAAAAGATTSASAASAAAAIPRRAIARLAPGGPAGIVTAGASASASRIWKNSRGAKRNAFATSTAGNTWTWVL